MKKLPLFLLLLTLPLSAVDFDLTAYGDYYGDAEPSTPYENIRSRIYVRPEVTGTLIKRRLNFHLSANLYADPLGGPLLVPPEHILREGYFKLFMGNFSLSLGQKFVNWGKVDFYSPINVMNPIDTTVPSLDNVEESRLPVLMADLVMKLGDSAILEFIYEPFLRPYYYPDEQLDIKVDLLAFDIDAAFAHEKVPYLSQEAHSVFAALNYWSYWYDLLLSYAWYTDPYPDFDLTGISQEVDTSGYINKYIIRGKALNTYSRAHLIGLAASTNFEGWGFDFENALKITEDWQGSKAEIKNSEWVANFQINKTLFTEWFFQFNTIYRYVINHGEAPVSELHSALLTSIESEMQKRFLQPEQSTVYIAGHIHRYILNETLYLALNSGFGFSPSAEMYENEIYAAPRISYLFSDHWKLNAGADLYLQGHEAGYIGRNRLKDNFYIRVVFEI